MRRRRSLATRIALLSVGIAVVTALIAGLLATGLIRNVGAESARKTLARLADVAQSVGTAPARNKSADKAQARVRAALQGINVRTGVVTSDGRLVTQAPVVRAAVDQRDIDRVVGGSEVSATRSANGTTVFVEGRPTFDGRGVFVVQAQRDATAPDERAIDRILLALLIAAVVAIVLGLLVAWRLARPLRRTAAAAHSLAAGNREITLPAQGPAEVVEVSEAVNRIAGALRHSEARQREFLLSVSHDLRTPLTAISGYAESLADGVIPPDETAHVGGVVLGEAKRLERLVGDLLDLARLGAQDFRVEFATVDLVALAAAAGRVWAARCSGGGVEFRLETPDAPVWAHTDAARLRQLLDGLFDNALRVTPAGAPIVLAVRPEAGPPVIEVRDGGPGLTDDDLAVAFEQGALFDRYRGVRQVGTGLGLAIVHGLARRLGGTVEAGHAGEGGARFTVRLPADSAPVPAPKDRAPAG